MHSFKVPSVVGKQRQIVAQGRCSYPEVGVTDEGIAGSQHASLLPKDSADFIVYLNDGNLREYQPQRAFTAWGLGSTIHAFVELAHRHYAQADPIRGQLFNASSHLCVAPEVKDEPICIHQVLHGVTAWARAACLSVGWSVCP